MEHAFNTLVRDIEKKYDLHCVIESDGVLGRINDIEIGTNLYLIIQEAAKNAAKHGHAENVKITLKSDDDYLHLNIEDDGRGLAAAKNKGEEGMGIHIMRHRMELMGGTLKINESSHFNNIGADISCTMPLKVLK